MLKLVSDPNLPIDNLALSELVYEKFTERKSQTNEDGSEIELNQAEKWIFTKAMSYISHSTGRDIVETATVEARKLEIFSATGIDEVQKLNIHGYKRQGLGEIMYLTDDLVIEQHGAHGSKPLQHMRITNFSNFIELDFEVGTRKFIQYFKFRVLIPCNWPVAFQYGQKRRYITITADWYTDMAYIESTSADILLLKNNRYSEYFNDHYETSIFFINMELVRNSGYRINFHLKSEGQIPEGGELQFREIKFVI